MSIIPWLDGPIRAFYRALMSPLNVALMIGRTRDLPLIFSASKAKS